MLQIAKMNFTEMTMAEIQYAARVNPHVSGVINQQQIAPNVVETISKTILVLLPVRILSGRITQI